MSEPSASALSADTLERIAAATADVFPRTIAACVFGSAARGEMRPFSDVDLGLLLPYEPDLLDLGELAGRVEDICRRPVDIVRLRGLPERDPELAFRIADEGVPILESRRYAFADFKKDAFLWYMDTAPLSGRFARLEENIAELSALGTEGVAGRRADWALRYGLVESIQIIIDLACQVVARRNLASPASYRECIEALSAAGLLQEELADSIKRMIGLRNLLIHEYDDVDTARLLPLLDRLNDLRAFAAWYVRLEQV
jgi:uncharacterized protein YutE (UPF0331/DUF86 family)/predicted nucleotidyltransferase